MLNLHTQLELVQEALCIQRLQCIILEMFPKPKWPDMVRGANSNAVLVPQNLL